ncbi:putative quinol monooxygenase [Jannaschia sp. 2305UL9-9]|uniref:putative quinol monooxygenase n=1 Tax=Jannaschia sp. 2305UL9-9 TaxID=3121638 RepID=UPI0035284BCE
MITRYALFEGTVKDGHRDAFRTAVQERLVPLWRQFPGNVAVRVMFGEERDEGAPEFPLILAITYADRDGMESALGSPFRAQSREVTAEIVAAHFDGRIHHHVTEAHEWLA